MDAREILADGIEQLFDWLLDNTKDLSEEQMNWLPPGKGVSIGFNLWHTVRTADNIANFVFRRQQPIWITQGFFERLGLPKVDQGTGMGIEDARALKIASKDALLEYTRLVGEDTVAFVREIDPEELSRVQLIKPLGEMPKVNVLRQIVMTHGFMHLGEINALKGQLGLQFGI